MGEDNATLFLWESNHRDLILLPYLNFLISDKV